jgi:hypothetical protein
MSLFSGCQIEIENLLTMRANICHYCAILGMNAPCIVSYQTWNDGANMNCYCCTTDSKLLNANVLLVSDEAFLLLVLINGGARWMSEIKRENGKVCILCDQCKFNSIVSYHCCTMPTEERNLDGRAGTHSIRK